MRDLGGAGATERLLLAQAVGLAMARRAADILGRHSSLARHDAAWTRPALGGKRLDTAQYAADDAIFTAVLDATNECLGQFDARPADDRWCDALLELIQLAQFAAETA